MTDHQKKILVNLIKTDLQDFLNNKKRLEKGWYFFPYDDMSGKIWIIKNRGKGVIISSEIEDLVRENARANASRRQEYHEKVMAEEKKRKQKEGLNWPDLPFELDEKEIWQEELEKEDYDEIVNLISQVKQASDDAEQRQRRERNEKLTSHPQLFYWGGNGYINPRYLNEWKKEKYRYFSKKITEKEHRALHINSLHPVLNNFPFHKEGFYIIEGTENLPWQSRPFNSFGSNFNKLVELNDKITITPYEAETDNELLEKKIKDCDVCQRNFDNTEKLYVILRYHGKMSGVIQTCSKCYKNKEQEYLQNYEKIFYYPTGNRKILQSIKRGEFDCYAGKKDQNGKILQQQNCSHCQPWKQHEVNNKDKLDTAFLTEYFRKNHIKKIQLTNDNLIITHNNNNNNETITSEQLTNSPEYQLIKTNLQRTNKNELTSAELGLDSNPSPSQNKYLWLGGGIALGAVLVGLCFFYWQQKRKKNK